MSESIETVTSVYTVNYTRQDSRQGTHAMKLFISS